MTRHRERTKNQPSNMTDISNDISIGNLVNLKTTNNSQRINDLQDAFRRSYGIAPQFLVNVPGR